MTTAHKLEVIAGLLDGVRWNRDRTALRACCPREHSERTAGLSVRLHDDRILVHCFKGCGAIDVLDALGLDWSALYPDRERKDHRLRKAPPVPYADALRCIAAEVWHVLICAGRIETGTGLDRSELDRLTRAVDRITEAARTVRLFS